MPKLNPRNTALWQKRIADWKQSGQSGSQWCRTNDITYSTFQYWKRRLIPSGEEEVSGGFIELSGRSAAPVEAGIEIRVGQMRIQLQRDFDEATLGRLLLVLGRAA